MLDLILVPLDGSLLAECVLPHVVAIGRAFDAKVVLLRVLGPNQESESAQASDPLNWQINRVEARLYLEGIEAQLQEVGIQTQVALSEGSVADSITEFARTKGMNLIILSTYGRSGLSKWGISGIVQKVMLSAPTSVMIVRARQPLISPRTDRPYARLLVPLDGSWRAEYALPIIRRLACVHQAQVHVVHVVKKPEMARHMPPTQEDISLANRLVARNQEEATHYLDQLPLCSPLAGIDVQTHLLISDNVTAALHEVVERERIDMVALSAHGYSGNIRWPYGNMVNNFTLYSPVPLLVIQDLPATETLMVTDVAVRNPRPETAQIMEG